MCCSYKPTAKVFSAILLGISSIAMSNSIATAQGPTCTPPAIDISRSLVVTDAALDKTKFAFAKTIDAILGSMNVAQTPENRENFVKSMLTSFQDDAMVNPVSGLRIKVDVRQREANLDPKKLLNPGDPIGLVPIALFNRLDAAPEDWSNCGEHRIVYSFKAPVPLGGPGSRFFLIFEARTANSSAQGAGFEGCRATANFWRSLTDENDAAKRADRLEQFYYLGIAEASGPVVQAKNYGGPLGQVRGNVFMNAPGDFKWQLREWIVVNSGQPTPASFVPVTVKDNPLAQFYLDTNGAAGGPDAPADPAKEASERTEFQNQFLNTSLARLLDPDVVLNFLTVGQPGYKPELDPKNAAFDIEKYKIEVLARFGARFENRFNEFQSVSQGGEDNPQAKAGGTLKNNITTALGSFVIDAQQKPDVTHVLNRAGAVSCGGCHEFTADKPVGQVKGQPILWPKSAGFVQTTETGELSDALTKVLLPFRRDRFADALCIPVTPVVTSAAPSASVARQSAQQSRWQSLVAAARDEKDPGLQRTRTREAVQAITVQRQEEIQKPGYFVTNRRPH